MSDAKNTTVLKEAINVRYAEAATSCCSLSCGSAIDQADPQPGERFVDLGSGRGQDVFRAARRVGKEGIAYGVDFTEEMLALSEANRIKLRIDNAKFINATIDSIPLDDAVIDCVISNCTINHAKDKAAVYAEIRRILKPGGRFVVSDVLAEKDLPESIKSDPDAWAACYGGAIVKEDYLRAIAAAGFREVEILEESAPYEKGGVSVMSVTLRGVKEY
jgi:ubiquinone/menaquinone biosynthesis C-methylase UbiE